MVDLDNPNVVVLDLVVRKLILQQCQFVRLMGSEKVTAEVGAKALSVASEFDRFSEDLAGDFKDDGI